jgi:hypothetical protein
VNTDCGLRTRTWEVSLEKLRNMVEGARLAEKELNGSWLYKRGPIDKLDLFEAQGGSKGPDTVFGLALSVVEYAVLASGSIEKPHERANLFTIRQLIATYMNASLVSVSLS